LLASQRNEGKAKKAGTTISKPQSVALDSDLEAKLAARRARDHATAPPAGGQKTSVDDVPTDLKATASLAKARTDACEVQSPAQKEEEGRGVLLQSGSKSPRGPSLGQGWLNSALNANGDANADAHVDGQMMSEVGVIGESSEIYPEVDFQSMMLGHGGGLLGHGLYSNYLPPYDPTGVSSEGGNDPLEDIIKGSLAVQGFGGGGDGRDLESLLAEALGNETAGFDPCKCSEKSCMYYIYIYIYRKSDRKALTRVNVLKSQKSVGYSI
jgi:hypothetical protein